MKLSELIDSLQSMYEINGDDEIIVTNNKIVIGLKNSDRTITVNWK